ncbi:hypothetical protein DFH09DRAFT_592432 [Mycena vulgaris]|nr:hypothetical protein DFH09DRAFT_592432 [Mycena vulgaris]
MDLLQSLWRRSWYRKSLRDSERHISMRTPSWEHPLRWSSSRSVSRNNPSSDFSSVLCLPKFSTEISQLLKPWLRVRQPWWPWSVPTSTSPGRLSATYVTQPVRLFVHFRCLTKAEGSVSLAVFSLLPQIRSFTCNSKTVFKTTPSSIPSGTFDTLVDLTIDVFDSSFLTVLSHLELPSLRSTTFPAKATAGNMFFRKHGKKLLQLTVSVLQLDSDTPIFQHCPSLYLLGITCDGRSLPRRFELSEKHVCLERIVFETQPRFGVSEGKMHNFIYDIDRKWFPAFREIHHLCCTWPTEN